MIRTLRIVAAVTLLMGSASGHCEISPQPIAADAHIQAVAYDPQQVVALRVASGFAVTVNLSPEERIETVTVGDAGAWQVQVNRRADRMVIKPVGDPRTTNLTAITDQRSYNFTLYAASAGEDALPYMVNFLYPALAMVQPVAATTMSRYRVRGKKSLLPAAISDDGTFTSIFWPKDVTLPAVYRQDDQSHLALVNGLMRDGAFVIEGVYRRLVFMIGKARATATRDQTDDAR